MPGSTAIRHCTAINLHRSNKPHDCCGTTRLCLLTICYWLAAAHVESSLPASVHSTACCCWGHQNRVSDPSSSHRLLYRAEREHQDFHPLPKGPVVFLTTHVCPHIISKCDPVHRHRHQHHTSHTPCQTSRANLHSPSQAASLSHAHPWGNTPATVPTHCINHTAGAAVL